MTDREEYKINQYIKPGAIVPVDMQTTALLVDALRAALAQPEKTDMQIGITYEEANPPKPYCKRCGKKLGTEAHDVHTCTPKQPEPLWIRNREGKLELHAPPKKEWVELTKEEVENWNLPEKATVFEFVQFVDAKLKEKNT